MLTDLELLEKFLNVKIKEENTRISYKKSLNDFYKYIQGVGVSVRSAKSWDVDEYHLILKEKYAVATINSKLTAIKSFWNWLVNNDEVKKNIMNIEFEEADNVEDIFLDNEEIKLLLNYMFNRERIIDERLYEFKKSRDSFFVLLAIKTGMRYCELENLTEKSFDFDNMVINLPKDIRKNDRSLVVLIDDEIKRAYDVYMIERNKLKKKDDNIFLSVRGVRLSGKEGKGGSASVNVIIAKNIMNANKHYEEIGSDKKIRTDISCHSLRHTTGYLLMDRNYTLVQVARVLGHQSLKSTERYMHCSDRDLKEKQFNLL